jgi:Flp pilus assembly protein TadG
MTGTSRVESRRRRRGAVAVETAVVLPILLLFFAACYELGRFGRIAVSLSNAARNGAQYASTSPAAAGDLVRIRAAALTEMNNLPNITSTNPAVTSTILTVSGQQYVQVTVTYDLTGTSVFGLFNVKQMSRTVVLPMMPSS